MDKSITIHSKSSSLSPLLSLPPELRIQIYSLLLNDLTPPGLPRNLRTPQRIHPQILCVCHRTHAEALPILYAHNVFIAHYSLLSSLPSLRRWNAPVTSPHLIALIRWFHVYVRLDCDPHFSAEAAAEAFTGKEAVTIEAVQTQFQSADFGVLRRFEKVRGVTRARVIGSDVGFLAYARWLEGVMMSPVEVVVEEFDEERMGEGGEYDLWTHGGR